MQQWRVGAEVGEAGKRSATSQPSTGCRPLSVCCDARRSGPPPPEACPSPATEV
eukprot:COSAG04_NODE_490_length_13483_cov_5.310646_11_plen_54_part_00